MVEPSLGGGAPAPSPDPILVCVLNLFTGGAGSIILEQKSKGIIAIVACVLLLLPPSCGTLSGVVAVVMAIDAYFQAQMLQQGRTIGEWTWFQNAK